MRVAFWVNAPEGVQASQTTALLMAAAVRRGHAVCAAGVADLFVAPDDRVMARAVPVGDDAIDGASVARSLRGEAAVDVDLTAFDAVLVRTSPGRDERHWAHSTALVLGELLLHAGVEVLNRPGGLMKAGGKLYQAWLPRHLRPDALIAADAERLAAHVRDRGAPTVLKPAVGTRGRDVFKLEPDDPNTLVIAESLVRQGFALAQDYLPDAHRGDTRVLLLDGELLQVDGQVAAVRRVPQGGEFRSNVHMGARVAPAPLRPEMAEAAAAMGARLREHGLWLVGMDLIGDQVVELNVFSTGGLGDAERHTGVDFSAHIIANLERRRAAARG